MTDVAQAQSGSATADGGGEAAAAGGGESPAAEPWIGKGRGAKLLGASVAASGTSGAVAAAGRETRVEAGRQCGAQCGMRHLGSAAV